MGPEINIDSILALEKQIEEGLGDIIQLKRARNSLLNISTRVPPEVLGQVFHWNVIPVVDHGGLEKGSYNFLLVCNHWFEVASGTPELWAYWGNTLNQWSRRYKRSGTSPLDLALVAHRSMDPDPVLFDGPLRDAIRVRAACDSIRPIDLRGPDSGLLQSVISSLTLDGKEVRDSSIESLRVDNSSLDISPFLACYRFPRLRVLSLNCPITSPWDYLKLQATSLTTLSLWSVGSPTSITRHQFLSIFASYQNLQELSLCEVMVPNDTGDGPRSRAPLRQLKRLRLVGHYIGVLRLLDWLEHPDKMDSVYLNLSKCEGEVVSEFLGPYLQDRIRRDDRFQSKLGIKLLRGVSFISFRVGTLGQVNALPPLPGHGHPYVLLAVRFWDELLRDTMEGLCADLIAATPRERVVEYTGGPNLGVTMDLPVAMPNVENLYFVRSMITDTFLQPGQLSHTKLLPSLRHLYLDQPILRNGNWRPLITYLAHQTSGGQVISLRLRGNRPLVPPKAVREIEGLVDEFDLCYTGVEGQGHCLTSEFETRRSGLVDLGVACRVHTI